MKTYRKLENKSITVRIDNDGIFIAGLENVNASTYDITAAYDNKNSIYNPSTNKTVGMHDKNNYIGYDNRP